MKKLILPSLMAAFGWLSSLPAQNPAPSAAPATTPPASAAPVVPAAPPKSANKSPNPVPATTPGDPFVRDPHPQKTPPPAPVPEAEMVATNLFTTIETWSLSQADYTALLSGPTEEQGSYERLEALAKAGKAKLVGLIGLSTKSGQRAVTESFDEVRYPTEFTPAQRPGEIAFPTAFETRSAGDTLEIEPILGPDGKTIEVNLVPQSVHLEGFLDWQPEATAVPAAQPQFRTEKVTTSMVLTSGQPAFLATATPAQAGEEQDAKQIRVRVLRTTAQPVQPSPPLTRVAQMRIEFLLYSLDREAARGVLNHSADSGQSYAMVSALVAKGEARLEAVIALVAKSGQRAVNEEIAEYRYPTNFSPPRFDSETVPKENRQPASIATFETRNTGVAMEIEPVLGPDARMVDINVVPHVTRLVGMLKVSGGAAKYPTQPVFTMRQVTTSASLPLGIPVLLGTMSQPEESGVNDRKDDGRTSLAYIRVTPMQL